MVMMKRMKLMKLMMDFRVGVGLWGEEKARNLIETPSLLKIMGACLDDPQKARSKVSPFFFFALLEFLCKFSLSSLGSGGFSLVFTVLVLVFLNIIVRW